MRKRGLPAPERVLASATNTSTCPPPADQLTKDAMPYQG
jgi:hypothetical protein